MVFLVEAMLGGWGGNRATPETLGQDRHRR
jgi:hypothetical protein